MWSGATALILTAPHYDYLESTELLLERSDINVNISDDRGWTALHYACNGKCLELMDLLLERDDIDNNVGDVNGYTPLAIACNVATNAYTSDYLWESRIPTVRSLLSRRYTDPNILDKNGVSILAHVMDHPADSYYAGKIASLLRAAGARYTRP